MTDKKTTENPTEITDENLDQATGGADNTPMDFGDPIGAYNFKVEIEGVTQGAFKTSFDAVSDKSDK